MVASTADKPEIFDRAAVAEIVGIDYAVVKNWSTGKPITITPSIYAPNRKGAQSLYSRTDIYLFELAKELAELGIALEAVARTLAKLNLRWLDEDERGVLVLARLNTKNLVVEHIPGTLSGNDAAHEYARKIMPLMLSKQSSLVLSAHLNSILNDVDKRILKQKGTQGQ
ncbi:MAG: MerR family transcriptional regulator [Candidatus Angelobacter sp.]